MRILFIQQHLPKVLMGRWYTPQHLYQLTGGGPGTWINFYFPWTKGQIQPVCVSSCRAVAGCVTPGDVLFPEPLGLCSAPVQHPSSTDCSTFTLSTDVLLLQQMHCCPGQITYWSRCWFLFFKAKCTQCAALDSQQELLPPYTHTFPISSWWLCRHLPSFPVPGALLPSKAAFHSASECQRGLHIQIFEGNVKYWHRKRWDVWVTEKQG